MYKTEIFNDILKLKSTNQIINKRRVKSKFNADIRNNAIMIASLSIQIQKKIIISINGKYRGKKIRK